MTDSFPSFVDLAPARCPSHAAMLLAIEAEFAPVRPGTVLGQLDERARALFGVAGAPLREQAVALRSAAAPAASAITAERDWLVGAGLERGVAAAPLRAAVLVEIGRRAGLEVDLARAGARWGAIVRCDAGETTVPATGRLPCGGMTRVCAHQLGFTVLTGLAAALADPRAACHACSLRLRLPIDDATRERVHAELALLRGTA